MRGRKMFGIDDFIEKHCPKGVMYMDFGVVLGCKLSFQYLVRSSDCCYD